MAKRPKVVKCRGCDRKFADDDAMEEHYFVKHIAEPIDREEGLSAEDAIFLADTMDLPDGAYFAMIGDLMGGDYMDGIEAVIASQD